MIKDKASWFGKIRDIVADAVAYTVVAYGIIIFLLWLLQWVISEQVPLIGMIKSTIHLFLIPSLILLPLCLLLRKWQLSLALVPTFLAFVISYGIFFVPRGYEAAATAPELRIMTFNLQAPDEGMVESLIEIIQKADADVVAVQELSFVAADRFATALANHYPHQALHPQDYAHAGQGVLSRYSILADDYWHYGEDRNGEEHSRLGHQRVEIEVEGMEVVFYNTHPIPPYSSAGFHAEQHTQVLQDVLERAVSETAPVIMLGDFNMTDQFHEYRRITDYFTDAYKAVGDIGFGFTYPHDKWTGVPPLVRLDYIFYSRAWTGITAQVWPISGSSDHAPLLAHLTLSPQ